MSLGPFAKKALSKTLGITYEQISMGEEIAGKLMDSRINRSTAKSIWEKIKDYDVDQINEFLSKINNMLNE